MVVGLLPALCQSLLRTDALLERALRFYTGEGSHGSMVRRGLLLLTSFGGRAWGLSSTERLADGSGSDGGREVAERGAAAQSSCCGLDVEAEH